MQKSVCTVFWETFYGDRIEQHIPGQLLGLTNGKFSKANAV